jgi:hypothetical protein
VPEITINRTLLVLANLLIPPEGKRSLRIRAPIAAGTLFAGVIAPLMMGQSASVSVIFVDTDCLQVNQTDG